MRLHGYSALEGKPSELHALNYLCLSRKPRKRHSIGIPLLIAVKDVKVGLNTVSEEACTATLLMVST